MTETVRAAIVTPVYKSSLSPDEEISWNCLEQVLGHHKRFVLLPKGLAWERSGDRLELDAEHFASREAYSRLLLSESFYELFQHYEYLLIYQLDCLVFRDELHRWCEAGFDYLGAPWMPPAARTRVPRVGNGGFSLRRVAAFLEVLRSSRRPAWGTAFSVNVLPDLPLTKVLKRLRVIRAARRGAVAYAGSYTLNEDHFWSDRARLFAPGFRVAPVADALGFAFESAPRSCYDRTARLPFGCHAWARWDRAFWEEYLAALSLR